MSTPPYGPGINPQDPPPHGWQQYEPPGTLHSHLRPGASRRGPLSWILGGAISAVLGAAVMLLAHSLFVVMPASSNAPIEALATQATVLVGNWTGECTSTNSAPVPGSSHFEFTADGLFSTNSDKGKYSISTDGTVLMNFPQPDGTSSHFLAADFLAVRNQLALVGLHDLTSTAPTTALSSCLLQRVN